MSGRARRILEHEPGARVVVRRQPLHQSILAWRPLRRARLTGAAAGASARRTAGAASVRASRLPRRSRSAGGGGLQLQIGEALAVRAPRQLALAVLIPAAA